MVCGVRKSRKSIAYGKMVTMLLLTVFLNGYFVTCCTAAKSSHFDSDKSIRCDHTCDSSAF